MFYVLLLLCQPKQHTVLEITLQQSHIQLSNNQKPQIPSAGLFSIISSSNLNIYPHLPHSRCRFQCLFLLNFLRSPSSLLFFSKVNRHISLSFSSQERCSSPFTILVSYFGPFPVCPSMSQSFLYWELRTVHCTPGTASPVLRRREESPFLTCWWYFPNTAWALGKFSLLSSKAHCWLMFSLVSSRNPKSQLLLCQPSSFPDGLPPAYIDVWSVPPQYLALHILNFTKFFPAIPSSPLQPVKVPPDDKMFYGKFSTTYIILTLFDTF